jgi:hypothetical protein
MRAARRRSLNRQLHGRAICSDVETLMGRVRFRQSADIPAWLGLDVGGGKTCVHRQHTRISQVHAATRRVGRTSFRRRAYARGQRLHAACFR